MNYNNQTLPGFLLTIEDNAPVAENIAAVKDVTVIFGVLPETMKYVDMEGNTQEKFIEPNKPLLITSSDEAIKTLELSNVVLTREIKNMIKLMPTGTSLALCRLVLRNGDTPNLESDAQLFESLDFAFESTENYPIKEIYCAGLSLDKAVRIKGGFFDSKTNAIYKQIDKEDLEDMFVNIKNMNGTDSLTLSKKAEIDLVIERSEESILIPSDKGVFDKYSFMINGEIAKVVIDKADGTQSLEDATIKFTLDYSDPEKPIVTKFDAPKCIKPKFEILEDLNTSSKYIKLAIGGTLNIAIDEETYVETNHSATLEIKELGYGKTSPLTFATVVQKTEANADLLVRILKHCFTITSTMNNCLVFLSPEQPLNSSPSEIQKYVDKCNKMYSDIRDRVSTTVNGKKVDLGMFLNCVAGINKIDGIGGLYGFPQSAIAAVAGKDTIVTQRATSSFEVGDIVEIYTHKKLEIVTCKAKVVSVTISGTNATEIVIDKAIPDEVIKSVMPKYIMNVNNKDFNGNYMAIQHSNICKQAGMKRSPAGLSWPGECQVSFSTKQKDSMAGNKYSVLVQKVGTTQGELDRAQLMTGVMSQFQDWENIATIYKLVDGAKVIANKYKGARISDGTDLSLIKKEIEDSVFKPAINVFITPAYDLRLTTKKIIAPNGKREKALFVDFGVYEIETLKLIRMAARLY